MLGEYLGELQGKVITRRVIDITNGPTLEITLLREGKLKSVNITDMTTYTTTRALDGTWHGQGKGFYTTTDNSEVITQSGKGIGVFTEAKILQYRGSIYFNVVNKIDDGNLKFLNNLVVLFKNEDNVETGVNKIKLWEWK